VGIVLFLLLIPVATWLLAISDVDIADGRMHVFLTILLVSSLVGSDAQNALIICITGIVEFEASLYLLEKAHASS
jgi:hypothetical protein